MGFNVNIIGTRQLTARLKGKGKAIDRAMDAAMVWALLRIEGTTKKKLSGDVLNVGLTGDLRRSITGKKLGSGEEVSGIVGTAIVYAKTHELGLKINYPKRGFSIKFKKRAFLEPSLEQERSAVVRRFQQEIAKAVAS